MYRKTILALLLTAVFLLIGARQCCSEDPQPLPFTILHWNDFHAQNLPFEREFDGQKVKVGGVAHLTALLDSLRELEPRTFALHAGDEFTGTPISSITQGKSQIELLNVVKPDAFALGNHEFDYGWGTLKQRMTEANFPLLCCNVFDLETGGGIAPSYVIIERDGVKIAVIGVMVRSLASHVLADAVQGLRVEDPIPIVNRLLDDLCPQTDLQVALTHQGVEEDQRLAQGCPRLDVIVGGHRHAILFEPVMDNGIPILQAGSQGQYLGCFRALVDTAADRIVSFQEELILVESDKIPARPDVAQLVAGQEAQISAELDRVIGTLIVPWERVYDGESNVGDWTADAMIRLSGRDVAFINSGGFRRDVPAGPVTVRDLWELHPFGNRLMGFQLSGEELKKVISQQTKRQGGSLQVGGVRVLAKQDSSEIVEITVGGQPLETAKSYSIITNEYVVGHAERYFGFDLGERAITDLGWIDRELVQKAFEQDGTITSRVDRRMQLE
ncbi:MAG: bifunctional UDP-sugar hydrolase/5'-nucleotidase [bacterium]